MARHLIQIASVAILWFAFAPIALSQELSPEQVRSAVMRAGGLKPYLQALSDRIAKASGQMIDIETQLLGSAAIDSTLLHYAKKVNVERDEININEARNEIAKRNASFVCTAPIASVLIGELGAEYRYMIYSKSGVYLFHYSITKSTCGSYSKRG